VLPVKERLLPATKKNIIALKKGSVMAVNLKSLIARLQRRMPQCGWKGPRVSASRALNYDVEPEHLLLKLVKPQTTDISAYPRHYEINQSRVTKDLVRALDKLRTGNARTPRFRRACHSGLKRPGCLHPSITTRPRFDLDICC